MNQIVHGAGQLFDRRIRVETVAEIKVKVIDAQPAQGSVRRFEDVLAR